MYFSRCLFLFFVLPVVLRLSAQKFEVVHRSGFSHQYVVQRPLYLENPADTSSGRYMASFELRCSAHPIAIAAQGELLKIKAHEENANAFYVQSVTEYDSVITLLVRCYFLFDKAYKRNKESGLKNKIFVFDCYRRQGYYSQFYLNDSLNYLHSPEIFEINTIPGARYYLMPWNTTGITQCDDLPEYTMAIRKVRGPLRLKAGEGDGAFFAAFFNYNYITAADIKVKPREHFLRCGWYNLDYLDGRLVVEAAWLAGWWKP